MSPPPLQGLPVTTTGIGPQQQPQQSVDLASTVDLTADKTPIDYLTPPPNADFQYQNFQPSVVESMSLIRAELHQPQQNAAAASAAAAIQAPPPLPPLLPFAASSQAVHTSPFTPNSGGFSSAPQAQPPPTTLLSSPSNQVNSLSYAGQSALEQFTPYTPTLAHDPTVNHHLQPPHVQQQQNAGTRWELGFDANDILTPPFATATEQPGGGGVVGGGGGGGGQAFFQQDFGPEAASSVRHNKQYVGSGTQFFGGSVGGGGFDPAVNNNNRFTPSDVIIRSSPNNNNNNVYWGTPKTAQQQPLRPSPTFAEPNALRFNNNGNNHLHHGHHVNNNHHQSVDTFQMPFTGQFDGPLSQGTVADHVVHSSFRIKRQLDDYEEPLVASRRDGADDGDDDRGERFGDRKPVYSFVKTDKNGNFKWSVRHGY